MTRIADCTGNSEVTPWMPRKNIRSIGVARNHVVAMVQYIERFSDCFNPVAFADGKCAAETGIQREVVEAGSGISSNHVGNCAIRSRHTQAGSAACLLDCVHTRDNVE